VDSGYKPFGCGIRETAFSNEYLNLLDFPSLITSELKEKVASAKSKDPETCFIAKVYWKRTSNLPLLFRSRH
jgi:hypothetical protein